MINKLKCVIREIISTPYSEYYYKFQLKPLIKIYPITHFSKDKVLQNILYINTLDYRGGAAKSTYRLFKRAKQQGLKAKLLVSRSYKKEPDIIVLEKKSTWQQKCLYDYQDKQSLLDFFHLPSLDLTKNIHVQQADILHLQNLHGDYFTPFALPKLSAHRPVVWTLRDMQSITGHCAHSFDCDKWETGCGNCPNLLVYPPIEKDTTNLLWNIKKEIYASSFLNIVCPSNWLKQKVEKSILKNQNISLIYNGVDSTVFRPIPKGIAREKLNLPKDKIIFLFVADGGRNNYWKGGSYLEEVYKYFNNKPEILFINLGGADTGYAKDNWLNTPYTEDESQIALYYAAADLFIYPSLADTCPLVVLEAQACGTPVVAFRTGGIPELIKHGTTGYIAEYKNTRDFICGILFFLNDATKLKIAQSDSSKHISDSFTHEKTFKEYLRLYDQNIEQRKSGKYAGM